MLPLKQCFLIYSCLLDRFLRPIFVSHLKKMLNGIQFVIACVCFAISIWLFKDKSDVQGSFRDIGIGMIVSLTVTGLSKMYENRVYLRILLQSYIKPHRSVRVSMAYLFRIKVSGKYLLVRNHRRPETGYQPVGGVYKYLPNETTTLFNELGIENINGIEVDTDSRNDLRCVLSRRVKLPKFISWFNSKKDRETDPWREFYEELVKENILRHSDFPYIQYIHCKSDYEGIKPSTFFPTDEFLYADIFELKVESAAQQRALDELVTIDSTDFIFATPQEIDNGATATGKVILPHSKKLLT